MMYLSAVVTIVTVGDYEHCW